VRRKGEKKRLEGEEERRDERDERGRDERGQGEET